MDKIMKKMLVTDYDKTFCPVDSKIEENVIAANKFYDEGNIFVIATGNNYERFIKVVKEKNIKYNYLILDQGSVIVDDKNFVIKQYYIENSIANEVLIEMKKSVNKLVQNPNLRLDGNYKISTVYKENDNINSDNITKISIEFVNEEKAKTFTNSINKKFENKAVAYTMIFPEINIVEIVSAKTNKKEAIKVIQNIENIEKKEIYVVGDGYNDIEMITYFDGYCMKNSVDKLLKVCNKRVESVSNLINDIKM